MYFDISIAEKKKELYFYQFGTFSFFPSTTTFCK